jgi:plastocyanin
MRTGELITFQVNGMAAFATPNLTWQNDQSSHNVNLDVKTTVNQSVLLNPGWNLVSFNEESAAPLVLMMISSISTRVGRIVGETGFYSPTLPDQFVTLKELHSGKSYYIYINGSTTVSWQVNGVAVPASTPIPLHAGWNWVGAPPVSMTVSSALQSISSLFKRIINMTLVYDTSLDPSFNTLHNLTPPEGYLLYAKGSGSLIYPTVVGFGSPESGGYSTMAAENSATCPVVSNTPTFTFAYGSASYNGSDAPIGTVILAMSPRGEVVGCSVVSLAGNYGAMPIYGQDTTVDPAVPGMQAGEPVTFYINGTQATPNPVFTWNNDKDAHQVSLSANVTTAAPVADFSASVTNGDIPLAVQFTDKSTGSVTNRSWAFGDGQNSSQTSPQHTYTQAGTYTVSLTVTGPGGVNTKIMQDYIVVKNKNNLFIPLVRR